MGSSSLKSVDKTMIIMMMMGGARKALLLAVLLEFICTQSQGARCKFPSDWKGRYFQSGLGNVIIRDGLVTTKGTCIDQHRDYFLFANRENNCFQCLLVIRRHTNVLQYRESFCLPPDSLKNVCAQIRVETPLYTLVRDPSTPVACPFQDAYYFNYNDLQNGFCEQAISYAKPCIGNNKYLFHFKHCVDTATLNGKDLTVECLATWKDGSESYLYSRVTTVGINVKDDQYRCFNYQQFGSDVFMSMSGDATCRGLRTARDGQFVMELARDAFGWPLPSCRFPDWVRGMTWRDLEGRQLLKVDGAGQVLVEWYLKKSKQFLQSDYRCTEHVTSGGGGGGGGGGRSSAHTTKEVIVRSFSTHGCVSKHQCLKIKQRTMDVVELQRGNTIDVDANPRCLFTDIYQTLLNDELPSKAVCPGSGIYQATAKDQLCVFRLAVGCYNDTVIDVTSTCSGRGGQTTGLSLECLTSWPMADKDFVIVRELGSDNRLANCLSFSSESRPTILEMDKLCNRDVPAIDAVFQSNAFIKIDDCKGDVTRSWPGKTSAAATKLSTKVPPVFPTVPLRNTMQPPKGNVPSVQDTRSNGNYEPAVDESNFYDEGEYDGDGLDVDYKDVRGDRFPTSSDDVTSTSDASDDVGVARVSVSDVRATAKGDWSSLGYSGGRGTSHGGLYFSSHESDDDFEFANPPVDSANYPYKVGQQYNITSRDPELVAVGKTRNDRGENQNSRPGHSAGSGGSRGQLLDRWAGVVLSVQFLRAALLHQSIW